MLALAPTLLALVAAAGPAVAVGRLSGGEVSAEPAAFARAGERLELAATLTLPDGRCLAGRAGLSRGGIPCDLAPAEVAASARWFLALPDPRDYDNTAACAPEALRRGCHAPIAYRELELPELRGSLVADAASQPPLATLGTHRLFVRAQWDGTTLATPASLAASQPTDATAPELFQLVVRRDDGYVGRLTELLGTPFALYPAVLPGVGHQADQRLATDCVALVIYGRRRLGHAVGYMAPPALRKHLVRVGLANRLVAPDGGVADLGPVREGDVLHFGFQTAVVAEDRAPVGRLDAGDVVIHAYHGLAELRPVGRLPYGDRPVELLRWPGP